jgi:Ca2+-binding RTX toxin-like protein
VHHAVGITVAAALGAVLVIPASALASVSAWVSYPVPSFENGGLHVEGTATDDSVSVSVDESTGEFVVADPDGVTVPPSCTAESPTAARCPVLAPFAEVTLGGGDDALHFDSSLTPVQVAAQGGSGSDAIEVAAETNGLLYGGPGDDVILGGAANDRVEGGRGADRLVGRGGGDYVIGGGGPDWLAGGADDDWVFANDHRRDAAVRCGGSRKDRVRLDAGLDPAPRGCPRRLTQGPN